MDTRVSQPAPARNQEAIDELRAIRQILTAFYKLANEFCGAYLNAKFKYGKSEDRWGRP